MVIRGSTNVGARENKTLESPTDGRYNNPERIVDGEISASQSQVIGNNIDDKVRKAVDNAVKTVENRMLDAILAALDKIVISRAEMAVRPITGSSGHGPGSTIQNPNRSNFIGNTEIMPLKLASNRLILNIDQE